MKVKALKSYYLKNKRYEAGDTFDIEDRIANVLVARKLAVISDDDTIVEVKQTYKNKSIEVSNDRMLVSDTKEKPLKKAAKKTSKKSKESDTKTEVKKTGRKKKVAE